MYGVKKVVFGDMVVGGAVGEEYGGTAGTKQAVGNELGMIFSQVAIFCNALCTHYQRVGVLVHLSN